MPDLSRDLRRSLENIIKSARTAAEAGAADALRRLGVAAAELPAHLESRRAERNRLRAHARSLGDRLLKDGAHEVRRLTEAAAYVQWHRLLFARFMLERGLLHDDAGVPLSLADCREEAAMNGADDEWSIAAAHAARLLPGVFPPDDPVESLTLAPEHAKALRDHLRKLDAAILAADDSLGWTYQFWRAAEKQAVNDSQVKIGAAELPAVTQLFTEPYMVRFLLHNTLGAWWAGKVLSARQELARDAADEASLRAACALPGYVWDYLRFVREDGTWRPAAGVFPGWPVRASEITLLDPCCGSGHFLTEALKALAALRGAEERLSSADAVLAVLRDNLHGLEIDGRCVQIAAFALALTAWRIGGAETKLPTPHVAWVGAPPPLPKSEFAALANGDADLRRGLEALHELFVQAPLLGSLIEVRGGDLASQTRIARVEESISSLVKRTRDAEPQRAEGAIAARGMVGALEVLNSRFVLITTNFPFLTEIKFSSDLVAALTNRERLGRANIATLFIEKSTKWLNIGGALAFVDPQAWWFLKIYTDIRSWACHQSSVRILARLGDKAFESPQAGGELVGLNILSAENPPVRHVISALDASAAKLHEEKPDALIYGRITEVTLRQVLSKVDNVIVFAEVSRTNMKLRDIATTLRGVGTGDSSRFVRMFWEPSHLSEDWELHQSTTSRTELFSGMSEIIY